MEITEIKKQWENAAPGWAKWEDVFVRLTKPATEAMLDMAGVDPGARVIDLACGAGSQTLMAARRVGDQGQVVANDISDRMLHRLQDKVKVERLNNVSTVLGAAEKLDVPGESFDAVICRLGLMLFAQPGKALALVNRALKVGGKMSIMVFTTPSANAFMAKPMQILLRHAGKNPPALGRTWNIFSWFTRSS